MNTSQTNTPAPLLTSLSHGGGCGCKIAPGVLRDILQSTHGMAVPEQLLVGIETADDAAVYQLNEHQALIATTDFFMPIVDDPYDFGRIAATNAISDVYAMGGTPIMALGIVGMPVNVLPLQTIGRILQGGQTIDSVEPIYGLVVLGLVHPSRVKRNNGAQVGDVLVLGKPIGVGVLSAALKKEMLDDAGYQEMLRLTTQLNRPGTALAALEGVHALTDVTGFGLAGHALELARGAHCQVQIDWPAVSWVTQAQALAQKGCITGASARNWASYGHEIELPPGFSAVDQALLTDPQTSGGLLVSCAPDRVSEVLNIFHTAGFSQAGVVGQVQAGTGLKIRG
jgi:selenide, water dikinase